MTEEAEDSANSSDSQRSTRSIEDFILQMEDQTARSSLSRQNTPDFAKLLKYIQQDESSAFDSNALPLPHELSPTDSGYQPQSNASTKGETFDCQALHDFSPSSSSVSFRHDNSQAMKPSRQKYPGKYNFSISFFRRDDVTKNMPYTYSEVLGKLYIKKDQCCPVKFNCQNPPPGSAVRAMLVYHEENYVHQPVSRCISHKISDASEYATHVLRVQNQSGAKYELLNGHNCVMVPFLSPAVGAEPFTALYKFMCLSTCTGGINRRSTCVVFTLEDSFGSVLGRDCFQVKICTCPGRDRPKDEKRKHKLSNMGDVSVQSSKRINLGRGAMIPQPGYRLLAVPEEHYELMSKVLDAIKLSSLVSEERRREYYLSEAQVSHYVQLSSSEEPA